MTELSCNFLLVGQLILVVTIMASETIRHGYSGRMKMQVRKRQVEMCKEGMREYRKMKYIYDWAGVENASTNSAGI